MGPLQAARVGHQLPPCWHVMMDEDALVQRCVQGDTEAFSQLVTRFERPLFNVALRVLRDREAARDVVQTAFLRAWKHLGSYRPEHRFFSWIYRITYNEAVNQLRKRRTEPLDDQLASSDRRPDEAAADEQLAMMIEQAVNELDEDLRQVIMLRHWLDQSYDEMAEVLGIPAKTVKSRLFTARQRLAKVLQKRGVRAT